MLNISPDSLATMSAPKIKAAALAAHAAAISNPNTDWRALADALALALTGKPRAAASSDKPPVWWQDGALKRNGAYERGLFNVLFADGVQVRCNVHRQPGKPWLVAKAMRVAIGFYRSRVGDLRHERAVPDVLCAANLTSDETHDSAVCNALTAELRARSLTPYVPTLADKLAKAERLAVLARARIETGKLQQALAYMDARDAEARYGVGSRRDDSGDALRLAGDAALEAFEVAASGLRHESFTLHAWDESTLARLSRLAHGEPRSRVYAYCEAEIAVAPLAPLAPRSRVYAYQEAEIPAPVWNGPRARVYVRPASRARVYVEPAIAWRYEWVRFQEDRFALEPRGENPLASQGRLAIAGRCQDGFMVTCADRKPDGRSGVRSTVKRDLFAAFAWAVERLRESGFALEPRGVVEPEPEPEPPAPKPTRKREPAPVLPRAWMRKPREPAPVLAPPVVAFEGGGPVVALRIGPDGRRASARLLGVFAGFSAAWESVAARFTLAAEPVAHGQDFAECRIHRSSDNVRFELRAA